MGNLPDRQTANFQKEVIDKFLTRNKEIILSIRIFFNLKKWQIELIADPESDVPPLRSGGILPPPAGNLPPPLWDCTSILKV